MNRKSEANCVKIWVLSNPFITDVVIKLFLRSELFECEVADGPGLLEEASRIVASPSKELLLSLIHKILSGSIAEI